MTEFSQILRVTFCWVKAPLNILYSFQRVINKARADIFGRKTEFNHLSCLTLMHHYISLEMAIYGLLWPLQIERMAFFFLKYVQEQDDRTFHCHENHLTIYYGLVCS